MKNSCKNSSSVISRGISLILFPPNSTQQYLETVFWGSKCDWESIRFWWYYWNLNFLVSTCIESFKSRPSDRCQQSKTLTSNIVISNIEQNKSRPVVADHLFYVRPFEVLIAFLWIMYLDLNYFPWWCASNLRSDCGQKVSVLLRFCEIEIIHSNCGYIDGLFEVLYKETLLWPEWQIQSSCLPHVLPPASFCSILSSSVWAELQQDTRSYFQRSCVPSPKRIHASI